LITARTAARSANRLQSRDANGWQNLIYITQLADLPARSIFASASVAQGLASSASPGRAVDKRPLIYLVCKLHIGLIQSGGGTGPTMPQQPALKVLVLNPAGFRSRIPER